MSVNKGSSAAHSLLLVWGAAVPIFSAYLLLVGTLYEWAFWSQFNIAFFEFASIEQIVRPAALHVVPPALILGLGGALAVLIYNPKPVQIENRRVFLIFRPFLVLLLALAAALIWTGNIHWWFTAAGMIAFVMGMTLHYRLDILRGVHDQAVGAFCLFVVLWGLAFALPMGASAAFDIRRGSAPLLQDSLRSLLAEKSGADSVPPYRYVGLLGSRIFLLDQSGRLFAVKSDALDVVQFGPAQRAR